ncbi:MAG TPA: hypothetical protein VIT62_06530 [Lysobacter sp.]
MEDPALRVHWFRVLSDLTHQGFRSRSVARRLAVAKSTVLGWKAGAEPRHSDGERLIALWCEKTGREKSSVPVISYYDWRA